MLGVTLRWTIQGGVEILLVASCYRNRDKLRPDGPLGPNADFTFYHMFSINAHKNFYMYSAMINIHHQ